MNDFEMPTKLTTKEYFSRAREVHGDRYDYSSTVYNGALSKLTIKCPEHGLFSMVARDHTDKKRECPNCRKHKHYTTKTFVIAATSKHGTKYDYAKTLYVKSHLPIIIVCPIHGDFEQKPVNHLAGRGCKQCKADGLSKRTKYTREKFIELAKLKHGDKYNYAKVNYINSNTEVEIGCHKHGNFFQKPRNHLFGWGCVKCKNEKTGLRCKFTGGRFLEKAHKKHGNTYRYFDDYIDMTTLIDIECELHGIFTQRPVNHLQGQGCPRCKAAKISRSKTYSNEEFLQRARTKHGDTYEYPDAYVDAAQKLRIVCSSHGSFYQTGHNHLNGQGCPICKSSKGEKAVKRWLDTLGISYTRQFTFDLRRTRVSLRYDFYVPDYNACIEYDGRQHSIAINHFGGEEGLKETQRRDNLKNKECPSYGVRLIRVTHQDLDEGILEDKLHNGIFKDKENDIGIQVWYN